MCGIAGIVNAGGAPADMSLLQRMTRRLVHRGPDDEGFWAQGPVGLAARRLSIIDVQGGHQPIPNEDDTCCITYNGEIYNFLELRRELETRGHVFRTQGDTETILHAYEEYGADCVHKMNGMFAFAIWDGRNRSLFLVRDRLGIKPLYYHLGTEGLTFASELPALLEVPWIPRRISASSLLQYLRYGYVPDPDTIYQEVRQLLPGHVLIFRDGRAKTIQYWDLDLSRPQDRSPQEWREEIRSLLEDAVRIRLMSEVPLGVLLSGGLDSSAVTGIVARSLPHPVQTFSMGGGRGVFDERPYAKIVAEANGTEHHARLLDEPGVDDIFRILSRFGEPHADSSAIPTYFVSRLARERVTVALSGEGGDELFAGYAWHQQFRRIERLRRLAFPILKPLAAFTAGTGRDLIECFHRNGSGRLRQRVKTAVGFLTEPPDGSFERLRSLFSDDLVGVLSPGLREMYRRERPPCLLANTFRQAPAVDSVGRMLYTEAKTYLACDLLRKVDRMSMAHSLEVRVPLLDYRLVELVSSVPSSLKLKGTTSKYIFRESVRDLLPDAIQTRGKRGFAVPLDHWFRWILAEPARDFLLNGEMMRQMFHVPTCARLLDAHQRREIEAGSFLWMLFALALWLHETPAISM